MRILDTRNACLLGEVLLQTDDRNDVWNQTNCWFWILQFPDLPFSRDGGNEKKKQLVSAYFKEGETPAPTYWSHRASDRP